MTFFGKDFHKISIENMAIAARQVFEKEKQVASEEIKNLYNEVKGVVTGSAAATSSTNIEKVLDEKFVDNELQHKQFDAGVRAHKRGYGDLSPFYENATADYFFKCGYNGASFAEAQETLTAKIKDFLEQDSIVLETVKDLQTETNNAG